VLRRLTFLSDDIGRVAQSGDFTGQVREEGSDELSRLARAINQLLKAVVQSRAALQESNTQLAARSQALEEHTEEFDTLLNTMGEGVLYIVDNQIAYSNQAMAHLLLYRPEDLVTLPFSSLFTGGDVVTLPQRSSFTPFSRERTLVRRDGNVVRVALVVTPLHEGEYVIVVRDITQEKLAEAQRDMFFQRASHELRTPLTNIITRLYLIEKNPEKAQQHLNVLTEAAHQMRTLVDSIFDVTQVEQDVTLVPLNLYDVISQVVRTKQPLAAEKGILLDFATPPGMYALWGDSKRLTQAASYLLDYAVMRLTSGQQVTLSLKDENGRITFTIQGTGLTIPEHLQAQIFDPFYADETTGYRGSLGLYIARQVASLHSGELCIEKSPDQGATVFCMMLPSQAR
jgi:PAS domain S-box-containing protein